MPDLPEDTSVPPEPVYGPLLRRRFGGAALGAMSGGFAGWLAALIGDVHGVMFGSVIAGLAALAALFGYRYGPGVVGAVFAAFSEAGVGR